MPFRHFIPPRAFATAALALCLFSCRKEKTPPPSSSAPAPAKSIERGPILPPTPQPAAALKIATVDMTRIFKESPKTREVEKDQQADLARVQQENQTRLERIRALDTELEGLTKTLADPTVSDMRKQATFKERSAKMEDAIAFDRERREFLQRRQQALREQAARRVQALLQEIRLVVTEVAREESYDYVFDVSAQSVNHIPFMLMSRDSGPDLTDLIIEQLKRDAPPTAESGAGTGAAIPLEMNDDP